eukprot:TRINITY_DN13352_c0_g1_i1.p1 TRINITY_DN13352_c0_g1~~TRINITY_DN13352_c0_g1_i1.p1  ORF type:complete len:966 (-),score=329.86 TRINITY_DN13352_c0_g1_i1:288-3185(-)
MASPSAMSRMSQSSKSVSSSKSLPSLGLGATSGSFGRSSNPMAMSQPLVQVEIAKRRVIRKAVALPTPGFGPVRSLEDKRLGFYASERGIEWERPHAMAKMPKEPLPALEEILGCAMREFDLRNARMSLLEEMQGRSSSSTSSSKKSVMFGGCGQVPYKGGPKLPTYRPKRVLEKLVKPMSRKPTVELQKPTLPPKDEGAMEYGEDSPEAKSLPAATDEENAKATRESFSAAKDWAGKKESQNPREDEDEDEGENASDIPFPWDDEYLRACFEKFDSDGDGEMFFEELMSLLQYLGARPSAEEVQGIVKEMTQFATLSCQEFIDFMHRFREYDVRSLRKMFDDADDDGSGELDFKELHRLMHTLGYTSTIAVTQEAMNYMDKNRNQSISFREFEGLRQHLRKTEGFLLAEIDELKKLFQRAFGDEAKTAEGLKRCELVSEECWRISTYVGFSASKEVVKKIADDMDGNNSGKVSFEEMLKVIREIRELEAKNIQALIKSRSPTCKLAVGDLDWCLNKLGYFVSEEAVNEIIKNTEREAEDVLQLEELQFFLQEYRRREGFTSAEVSELKEGFLRESGEEGELGALGTVDMGRVLRWFGFSISVQEVQKLITEIDFDGSGEVEFEEYLKLMRRFHQQEAMKRTAIFKKFDTYNSGRIDSDDFAEAIHIMQGVPPDEDLLLAAINPPPEQAEGTPEDAVPEAPAPVPPAPANEASEKAPSTRTTFRDAGLGKLDRNGFERFCKRYRDLIVKQVRASGGYTPAEIPQLRLVFEQFDTDKSGSIEKHELRALIAEYFPDATKSKEGRLTIMKLLDEIDDDGNMQIEFQEFLWFMRKCDDMRDANDMKLEAEILLELDLTVDEVDGWRQVFTQNVDWTGELKLHELIDLLGRVVEFSDEYREDLAQMVREVHPHGRESARFPQFLKLVRRLTEEDKLGVNNAAIRVMRRDEKNRQQQLLLRSFSRGSLGN